MSFYRPHKRRPARVSPELITKQAHKDECDINNILRQYRRTGIIQHIRRQAGSYIDLPEVVDYQVAMNTVIAAQDAFAALPAKVRARFNNDPEQFLNAFSDPEQEEDLRNLGLLEARQAPPADGAAPVREQAATAAGDAGEA